jgi:hypothetical protein
MWMLARRRVPGLSRTASTALRSVERGCGEGSGPVSTLLGPEGTRDLGVASTTGLGPECKPATRVCGARCLSSGSGFWLFFENYTVDASIFVVKL